LDKATEETAEQILANNISNPCPCGKCIPLWWK